MEIKYNQYTQTYQIIHNGQVLCASKKGEIQSDEDAAIWFEKIVKQWLESIENNGVILQ